MNTNDAFTSFYNKYSDILNTMAPMRRMIKRKQRLKVRPWISKGILKSMKIRNNTLQKISPENPYWKNWDFWKIRKMYFNDFFEKNKRYIKINATHGKSPPEMVKYWFHTFFHTSLIFHSCQKNCLLKCYKNIYDLVSLLLKIPLY